MKIRILPRLGCFHWLYLGVFGLLLLAPVSNKAQIPVEWDRTFGGSGWENLESSFQTADNGFILGGTSSSTNDGDISQAAYGGSDYWIVKSDGNGVLEWESRFGGSGSDHLWCVIPRYEGGYVLAGDSNSNQNGVKEEDSIGGKDFWVIMTDENGNKIWDRTIGGTQDDELFNVIPTKDSCYLLAGHSSSDAGANKSANSRGDKDFWIVKINRFGAIMWDRTIGGPGEDRLLSVKETEDGGFILGGGSRSNAGGEKSDNRFGTAGEADFWLVKVDQDGNKLWDRTFGGDLEDVLIDLEVTADNGFILVGQTRSPISGNKTSSFNGVWDAWVIKTDASGNKEWEQTFGGDQLDILTSVQENVIGNFIFGGISDSPPSGNKTAANQGTYDFWMLYLTAAGDKIWDMSYGGANAEALTEIHQINNGSYYLIGHSRSQVGGDKQAPNIGLNDFWILKTVCDRSIDLGMDTLICVGDSIALDATDTECVGCTYTWSDLGESVPNRTISPSASQLLEVYSVDSLGCAARDEIEITVNPLPLITLGNDTTVCAGESLTLNAGEGGATYQWSPVTQNLAVIQVDTSSTYAVTVTDAFGCNNTDSIAVHFNPILDTLNFQELPNVLNTAFEISFEITGGDSTSYLVLGIAGTIENSVFTSESLPCNTNYQFSIQDNFTCQIIEISGFNECPCTTDAGTMEVMELKICGTETATANHLADHTLADNDILIFVLHDESGTSLGNIFASHTSPSFSFTAANDLVYGTTYYISAVAGAADGNGGVIPADECFAVAAGTPVVFYPEAVATIIPLGGLAISCNQTSVLLDGNSSNAFGNLDFAWSLNEAVLSTTPAFEVVKAGTYELLVTDQVSACTATEVVEISSAIDLPTVLIDDPAVLNCTQTTIQLNAGSSSTGPNFSYQWSGTIDAGAQSLFPEISSPGTYELSITNTNNNCINTATVEIEIDTLRPVLTMEDELQLECLLPEVTLGVAVSAEGNPVSYLWQDDNAQSINGSALPTPSVSAAGVYTVIVTNLNNACTAEAQQTVLAAETIRTFDLNATSVTCYGDSDGTIQVDTVIGGTAPYLFSFAGAPFQSQKEFTGLAHGVYELGVQDINGCEVIETIVVESPSELMVDLGENLSIELGDVLELDAIPNRAIDSFYWETSAPIACEECLSTIAEPLLPSTYKITVWDENGCSATDLLSVFIFKNRRVYIPTAFSPNGDGINDFFMAYGAKEVAKINVLKVFDRWGASLFEVRDLAPGEETKGWDGYFQGRLLQTGVYSYFLEVSYTDGVVELFKGDVTLLH